MGFINKILSLFLIITAGFFGFVGYDLYKKSTAIEVSQGKVLDFFSQIKNDLIKQKMQAAQQGASAVEVSAPQGALIKSADSSWLGIQKNVKDTVVQIFSNVTDFNWLEPYKSPKSGEGAGSGFFINENGDIVTNYHVVAQASNIQIQIPSFGSERFDVQLVGGCPDRDLALLKLDDKAKKKIVEKLDPIPYLTLGNSDLILRSQEVLALGYPLAQTRLKSTLGIVSGRERLGYFGYIQITAPLNPGNSGGPALNNLGEVIGINSRGISEAQNVGYIIPINEVRSALKDLYTVPLLRKPVLGCIFTWATPEMVNYLNNPGDGGWYIAKVFDKTLLRSVDVREGDMLYEVNGHRINMYGELDVSWSEDKVTLFELLNRYTIGDDLNFLIYRNGKKVDVKFKLEHKYIPPVRSIYPEFEKKETDYEILGGMVVMNLSLNHVGMLISLAPDLVKFGRIENQQKPALIITNVFPNSQASKARVLGRGEVIDEVNGEKIETLDDFRKVVKKSKGTGYLTVRTTDNFYAVLSVEKILQDEGRLSTTHFYHPSTLLNDLS
jgi:serine protease Do